MNSKTVCRILKRKHEEFLASISDDKVRLLVQDNSFITGGAIASMLLGEKVNDYDYYFTNKETCKAVAEYYVKMFNDLHPDNTYLTTTKLTRPEVQEIDGRIKIVVPSAGITSEEETMGDYQYFEGQPDEAGEEWVEKTITDADSVDGKPMEEIEKPPYRPIFLSANAITLSQKIQLVIRFYGTPKEVHENYDFVHCTNYWMPANGNLVLKKAALESLLSRQLHYVGSLYPVCSVIRTRKFIRAGWHINAGQYLKMCFQVSGLDLTNLEILEDQLTGVDTAYFQQLIDYCKERQGEDEGFRVTMPYIASLVDKIF